MENIEMNEVVKTEVAETVAEAVATKNDGKRVLAAGYIGGLCGVAVALATMLTFEYVVTPIAKKVKNAGKKRKAKKTIVKEIKADDTDKMDDDDDIPDLG